MNLWLNPHVDAATEVSDFDLRALRTRRISLYLAVSPDNLQRVAPLYNLLFQQLIDLNTHCLPDAGSGTQVLVLLDEFARLGVASVLAQSFAYVAGYGLRLLPVIQSPAQLRALYGADITEEIISNCGAEVVFAPKELKVAQELSERLGAYTYSGRALSRPSGWSSGRRSLTDSDQRRPLMLPQELLQLPRDALIVLRAGVAPIRGRKITYFRERAFTARLRPPPVVKPRACADRATAAAPGLITKGASVAAPISGPAAAALNVDPLPSNADDAAVDAWVDRYLDRTLGHRHGALDHA
jgi:type IV secretion system protein VirD4